MKKLFISGALALSVFTFANSNVEKKEIKKEEAKQKNATKVQKLTKEQKKALALFIQWYSVSFQNACGSTTTVLFQSDNADGSQPFIRELAFAVNTGYYDCLD